MKAITIFCITLLVASTLSIQTSSQGKLSMTSMQNKLKELKNNQWKDLALDFVQLSVSVESPMSDLLQAFQDFHHDMGFKQEIEAHDFAVKQAEHNEWEAAIRSRIHHAERDIAEATSSLDNTLYPNKAFYEDAIQTDEDFIVYTHQERDVATANREASHAANEAWVAEAGAAVEAINYCLELLDDMNSGNAALIQTTKITRQFNKIQKLLADTEFGNEITALIKLADFANPEMLARLSQKFSDVRATMLTGTEETLAREADEAAEYATFMDLTAEDLDNAAARIVENTRLLNETIQAIADTEAFREVRRADLAVAEEDLADELARWATEVAIYEQMVEEMTNEMDAVSEIIDLFVQMAQNMSGDRFSEIDQM